MINTIARMPIITKGKTLILDGVGVGVGVGGAVVPAMETAGVTIGGD